MVVPFITICILEIIAAIFMGGFMHKNPGDLSSIISNLIINFITGVVIYNLAPTKKIYLSSIYLILLTASSLYLAIITNGNQMVIFGNEIYYKFRLITEIAKFAGLFFGIYGAYKSEEYELKSNDLAIIEN